MAKTIVSKMETLLFLYFSAIGLATNAQANQPKIKVSLEEVAQRVLRLFFSYKMHHCRSNL